MTEPPAAEQPPDQSPCGADGFPMTADEPDPPWQRLAVGMLLVEPVRELIRFIPLLIVLIFAGRAGDSGPPWGLIGTAAVIVLGISRWMTTRYRITPTVVEVRRGVLQRKHLTVPRDRVRTVDISAHPLQRLLGLVKVQIGTGTSHHSSEALALDGLRSTAAAALRTQLLHRSPAAAPEPGGQHAAGPPPPEVADEVELARLNPRWIGYAPATLSGFVTAAFLIGLAWRLVSEARVDPRQFGIVEQSLRYLRSTPLWLDVVQVAALALVVVSILSIAGYVLSFWGFRLSRHRAGTLQVSRGLLTTRATTIEERRLHGVERSDPLLLRLIGGSRLQAIATGLRSRGSERGGALLLPPAPRRVVEDVEAVVLGSDRIGSAELTPHGPAARRRRFTRALTAALIPVAALFALHEWARWPLAAAIGSLVLLPLAALLALDRYRSLGHAVVDGRLIVRVGSLARRRQVLAVPGVIGLTLRQSFFQRRGGLITVTATTAAGAQRYAVPDVPFADAMSLAVELLPHAGLFIPGRPGPGISEQDGPGGNDPAAALLRDEPSVSRLPA